MKYLLVIFILGVHAQASEFHFDVKVDFGVARGYRANNHFVFKNIPYAQPPVNDLRWKKPQPLQDTGRLEGRMHYGERCKQPAFNPFINYFTPIVQGLMSTKGSEDCLNLNIWTPILRDSRPRPVVVFVHGGAHYLGSNKLSAILGGNMAAEKDVIVVTVNYRLGPLGYMAYKDEVPANLALYDVIQALKWINKNISQFGGDTDRITLLGESAGGGIVLSMVASPLAAGLFDAAIVQSGHAVNMPLQSAYDLGDQLIEKLGCADREEPMNCLRKKRASKIVSAIKVGGLGNKTHVGPVVDGELLRHSVLETFRRGEHNRVPILIGTNKDEMTTLMPIFYRGSINSAEDYEELVELQFDSFAPAVLEKYPASNYDELRNGISDIMADSIFHGPASAQLSALSMSQREPVFRYVYAFESKNRLMRKFKAGHALEVGYIFGNPNGFTHPLGFSKREKMFSKKIMEVWSEFARTNGQEFEYVDTYNSSEQNYLKIDEELSQGFAFRRSYSDFWQDLEVPLVAAGHR